MMIYNLLPRDAYFLMNIIAFIDNKPTIIYLQTYLNHFYENR